MPSSTFREPRAILKTKMLSMHMPQLHPAWLLGTQHQPQGPDGLWDASSICCRWVTSSALLGLTSHLRLAFRSQGLTGKTKCYSFSRSPATLPWVLWILSLTTQCPITDTMYVHLSQEFYFDPLWAEKNVSLGFWSLTQPSHIKSVTLFLDLLINKMPWTWTSYLSSLSLCVLM